MHDQIDIGPCTFRCSATGRELRPGEEVYSVLAHQEGRFGRKDFSLEAWTGPPSGAIAWWRTIVPEKPSAGGRTARPAARFEMLSEILRTGEPPEFAYMLALFLLRRKILRFEGEIRYADDSKILLLSHPKSGATFQVPVAIPDPSRWPMLEQTLTRLLRLGSQQTPDT
jgi:hypothetical protein